MDRIENHLDSFGYDIDTYSNEFTNLTTAYERLKADMEGMQRDWEGEAFEELMTSFHNDQKKADQMVESLKTMLDNLRYADVQYSDCENQVRGIIDSIQV